MRRLRSIPRLVVACLLPLELSLPAGAMAVDSIVPQKPEASPALDGGSPDAASLPPAAPTEPAPPVPAGAREATKEKDYPNRDIWGVGVHPIIGYAPETSWVLGGGGALYFNPRPDDPNQRLDEYGLNVTYSLKRQGSVSFDATKYLRGNSHILSASLEFTNTPSSFYGIGPNQPESAEEHFTQNGIALTVGFRSKVSPDLYIGPQYDFFYSNLTNVQGPLLARGEIPGSGETHPSGLALVATYDTTNPELYKLHGTRISLSTGLYHSALGSSNTFGTTKLDVRHYVALGGRFVLALQASAKGAHGDVPFFYLPALGGNTLLRGYSSDQYLGNYFLGGQAELRFPLFWRFGGVAFVGVAEVERKIADFGKLVRAAGGLGLRVALNKKQTINLRFDFAFNSEGDNKRYIKLREAF